MFAAGWIASATVVALTSAGVLLQQWSASGCLARDCEGKFDQLRAALAAAVATVTAVAAGCFAIAGVAWIPWVAIAPMIALHVAIGLAVASLGLLAGYWAPVSTCQDRVAKATGPLREGEKASDPWFLRMMPKTPPAYERSIAARQSAKEVHSSQWFDCKLFDVHEWEVGAIAYIIGTPALPVTFKWTLAGNAVPAAYVQTSGTTSTMTLKSPPLTATTQLTVAVADANGFSRTLSVDLDLPGSRMTCQLILHFVPPMHQIPSDPPGPVEIPVEMDRLLQAVRIAMETDPGNEGLRTFNNKQS